MQRKRTALLITSVVLAALLVMACTQAYSSGQREPDSGGSATATPVRSAPISPSLEQIQYSFREVAQAALPVVVEINTIEVITQRIPRSQSPWDFFFGPGTPEQGDSQEREFRQPGLGSGVIVRKDGNKVYVLTNNHVAGQAEEISINLYDGREFKGKLVGSDPRRDLALVVFETREEVPVAVLGDSDQLQVGDLVLAVGNPFGFESTITMGIVSALGRQAEAGAQIANLTDYIQTDASINPGNSGGALVNLSGEVIGINTWIASRTGSSAGLGFAVPANTARKTIDEIISKGRVEYGWLGVQIGDLDDQRFPDFREQFEIGDARGAFVFNIFKGSPAHKAGVRPGDYITRVGQRNIRNADELTKVVGNLPPENDYEVRLLRDGEPVSLSIKLAIRAEDKEIAQQSKNLWPGMYIAPLVPDLRKQLSIPERLEGVLVTIVQEGSPSATAGFRQGDVILKIDDQEVRDAADFYRLMNASSGREVMIRLYRQETEIVIGLPR
ncbi:MAG: Do family serine endopeptidase [Spirochaetales bacterium]|nr:Do family serine endopeptidase [Spirochaetales bacterium]